MSKSFTLAGVSMSEYKKWCKDNKKPAYKSETKQEFFARIADGRLVRDESGHIIKKYKKNTTVRR